MNHRDRDVDRERDDGALRREGRRREPREKMSEAMEARTWRGDHGGDCSCDRCLCLPPYDRDEADFADEGPGEDEDLFDGDGEEDDHAEGA